MKRPFCLFVLSLILALLFACGKKGPLQAPLIKKPQKIDKASVIQRGERIILEWANPTAYVDGSPLPGISKVDIWMLEKDKPSSGEPQEMGLEVFEKEAKLEAVITDEQLGRLQIKKVKSQAPPEFRFSLPLDKEKLLTKTYVFGLRVSDERRKKSDFSSLLPFEPQALPLPPQNVRSEAFEDRIEVRWEPPLENIDRSTPPKIAGYNIYRREGEDPPLLLNTDLIKENLFEDKDFLFGKTYRYLVRASATETQPFFESGDAEAPELVPKDIFAPAPPSAAVAVAGAGLITLSWDSNKEKDLAGYKVWRKEEGQTEYTLLTPQSIAETSFTDSSVEKNKRYYYAITGVDTSGNESRKAEVSPETIKD